MKKIVTSLFLVGCMCFSPASMAFAADSLIYTNYNQDDMRIENNDSLSSLEEASAEVTYSDIQEAAEQGFEILAKIDDPDVLQDLVDSGDIEYGENGTLPDYVMLYKTIEEERSPSSTIMPTATSTISITKSNYYDGQYFEDYDRFVIDGPSSFTQSYSRTDTASWNGSMTGSVSVGGTVYTVANVQAAVSTSMGYTIGKSYTKTSTYSVNIPSGKYWTIKVWTSYRVFSYTAKVGTTTLGTGKSWYPNGLVILHTQYSK